MNDVKQEQVTSEGRKREGGMNKDFEQCLNDFKGVVYRLWQQWAT